MFHVGDERKLTVVVPVHFGHIGGSDVGGIDIAIFVGDTIVKNYHDRKTARGWGGKAKSSD